MCIDEFSLKHALTQGFILNTAGKGLVVLNIHCAKVVFQVLVGECRRREATGLARSLITEISRIKEFAFQFLWILNLNTQHDILYLLHVGLCSL